MAGLDTTPMSVANGKALYDEVRKNNPDAGTHADALVPSEQGAHGFRIQGAVMQVSNGSEWRNVEDGVSPCPGNVDILQATSRDQGAALRWRDPEDTEEAKWQRTIVVRKEGGYPLDPTDGTVIINETLRNLYSDTPFVDLGLVNGRRYYYAFFTKSTMGSINKNPENVAMVIPKPMEFYTAYVPTFATETDYKMELHGLLEQYKSTPSLALRDVLYAGGGLYTDEHGNEMCRLGYAQYRVSKEDGRIRFDWMPGSNDNLSDMGFVDYAFRCRGERVKDISISVWHAVWPPTYDAKPTSGRTLTPTAFFIPTDQQWDPNLLRNLVAYFRSYGYEPFTFVQVNYLMLITAILYGSIAGNSVISDVFDSDPSLFGIKDWTAYTLRQRTSNISQQGGSLFLGAKGTNSVCLDNDLDYAPAWVVPKVDGNPTSVGFTKSINANNEWPFFTTEIGASSNTFYRTQYSHGPYKGEPYGVGGAFGCGFSNTRVSSLFLLNSPTYSYVNSRITKIGEVLQ